MSLLRICSTAVVVFGVSASLEAQNPPRPIESAARSVTLPLAEYNRLLDLAARPAAPAPVAPAGAVLTSADLRVHVDRDSVQGEFVLEGQVLREGVNRVALMSGATLTNGTTNGRPLPLVTDGNSQSALLQGIGPFTLNLDWGTPLTLQPGRASFTLPAPPSGTARATFDIPGDQADVHVSGGLITRRTAANGRTVVEATLLPGAPTEVWWSMRDSAPVAANREVRMIADVMTLVTLGDAEVRMAALVDVTAVQGEPRTIAVRLPTGYEVTSITGGSLETSDVRDGGALMTMSDPTLRRHQFLIALERPHDAGSFTLDTEVVTLPDVQRERGEIAVEGLGTLELEASERDGIHRIDARELNQALQAMARTPVLAAFRYQRGSTSPQPGLALDVKRFTDAAVLAAMADSAVATTMVTSEGRALTEVKLQVRNRAQPFLKLTLPAGATLASVQVAGEPAKPVLGTDGTRVPLLRPGFHPNGSYEVSFVYMHAGTPFAKKGDLQMMLPKMDIAIGILRWEVFVPERYSTKVIDGNVIDQQIVTRSEAAQPAAQNAVFRGVVGGQLMSSLTAALPGQIRGRVTDSAGSSLPGVIVNIAVAGSNRTAVTGADGTYVLSGVPAGEVRATATLGGFTTALGTFLFNRQPMVWSPVLSSGSLQETVTVAGEATAESPLRADERKQPPSSEVLDLQRRAAGVLPIRIDIPHAGLSYRFVKPLVIDQDTSVTFRYKRR